DRRRFGLIKGLWRVITASPWLLLVLGGEMLNLLSQCVQTFANGRFGRCWRVIRIRQQWHYWPNGLPYAREKLSEGSN
ncbi:hypothetical protein, partial [Acetobacter oeni]|uniref:hypothetical protein n=1 Tax=Acetobacter oeni TaxID=304077 RepID=UPI00222FB3E7